MLVKEQQSSSKKSSAFLFSALAILFGIAAGMIVNSINNPLYVLVALVGLIGFVASVASVEFGLLLLVFITYTRFSDVAVHNYGAPSVAKSFIVLLLIAIFIRWAISNDQPRGLILPFILLTAYGLVGFSSLLYASYKDLVLLSLSNYVKDALIAIVVVALLRRPQQFRHVIYTLLVIGIFIGSLSVHQYLTRNFASDYGGFAVANYMNIVGATNDYRLTGPLGDPNFFAQVMVVLALLGVERFVHDKNMWVKILAGLCAAVSALTVVFTFSRGAIVAMAVSMAIFFWIYRLKPAQTIVVLVLGMILLLFVPSTFYDRILTIKDVLPSNNGELNVRQDKAIQGRASENLTALAMFTQHPLTGVGLNNFPQLYQDYTKSIGLAPSASQRSPHNLYLEVAAETGIIGLTVFLIMVIVAFRSILSARKKFMEARMEDYAHMVTGYAIAFGGYMLAAFFVHAAYPRYFYLLLGIAFALPVIFEQMQIDRENQFHQPDVASRYELAKNEINF